MQIHEITLTEAPQYTTPGGIIVPAGAKTAAAVSKAAAATTAPDAPTTTTTTPATPPTQDQINAAWQQRIAQVRQQNPGVGAGQMAMATKAAQWLTNKFPKWTNPPIQGTAPATPVPPAPTAVTPKTAPIPTTAVKKYPPITIGNPKNLQSQIYVWNGQQYIDQKTKRPMNPAMQKSMLGAIK